MNNTNEREPVKEERFKITPIVYLIVHGEEDTILLVQRRNGNYSLPARHLEEGETFFDTAIRGARQELDIDIDPSKITLSHISHIKDRDGHRLGVFVDVPAWEGMPINMAHDQHSTLAWASKNSLPSFTVSVVRNCLRMISEGKLLSEQGFRSRWEPSVSGV